MEKGILFPEAVKAIQEGQKTFCFADVKDSTLWNDSNQEMVSHEHALLLDAIIQHIIIK